MTASRRRFLYGLTGASVASLAGCSALPILGDDGVPPYARWMPSSDADVPTGTGFSYVDPGSIEPDSDVANWIGLPEDRDVTLPPYAATDVVLSASGSSTDSRAVGEPPSVSTGIEWSALDWVCVGPRSFQVLHGGGIASATRKAFEDSDVGGHEDTYRGFDLYSLDGEEPVVAAGDGSVVIHPLPTVPGEGVGLEPFIDVRRGEGRLVAEDQGYGALVARLGTGAAVNAYPPHDPYTLDGRDSAVAALDGARASGTRLTLGSDDATVRYVLLYEEGTDVSEERLRTLLAEKSPEARPATMNDEASFSISTTNRLAVVDTTLPVDELRETHLVYPV